jgi:hypothetical protein
LSTIGRSSILRFPWIALWIEPAARDTVAGNALGPIAVKIA